MFTQRPIFMKKTEKKKKPSSIFQNKMKFQDKSCVVLLLSHRLTICLGGDSRLPPHWVAVYCFGWSK